MILIVEPERRFAHTWAWADAEPRQETQVTWRIDPLPGGNSRITLVHEGWTEAGANASLRDDHEGYWSGYLDDLAAILAEGS